MVQASRLKDALAVVQSLATIVALAVGALWGLFLYEQQREFAAQLNIDHAIETVRLTPEHRLLNVTVSHENKGKRLIRMEEADIWVQVIDPLHPAIAEMLAQGRDPVQGDDHVVQWPLLCRQLSGQPLELEPNERHEDVYDFVIPAYIRTVRIYTYYANPDKDGIGWSKATIYDIDSKDTGNAQQQPDRSRPAPVCARDR